MDPPDESEKSIDDVYHDRNLLAIGFATIVAMTWGTGYAGYYYHDGWPVIWVETPAGQKSWHVMPDLEDVIDRPSRRASRPKDSTATIE